MGNISKHGVAASIIYLAVVNRRLLLKYAWKNFEAEMM